MNSMETGWIRFPFNFSRFLHGLAWILVLAMTGSGGSVHKLPKLCSEEGGGGGGGGEAKCEVKPSIGKLICRNDYKSMYRKDYRDSKSVIVCGWSDWYVNPEEILILFPFVEKLVIRDGNVSQFLTDFPASDHLENLVLRNLRIEMLRPTLFTFLTNLRYLDLRNNRLTNLNPNVLPHRLTMKKIYLTDNPWDCTSDLKWMVEDWAKEKLINGNGLLCSDSIYPGKPVASVMFLMKSMEEECPEEFCNCSMQNIVWDRSQNYLVPVITVNCSAQGLVKLPEKLPRNTTTLILNGNNITDLLPLVEDGTYANVADIYLDDNEIGNIGVLEGADWLSHFRVLSLKGNNLRELPTYVLDNAFEKNRNMAAIYLGGNPWKCDCMFTSDFQHLLIKYRSVVKDKQEITCADIQGGDDSPIPVIEVSIGSVCASGTNEINPLDIVSAVLAFLIVVVVGKLAYDYWTFKRTGKLPWIVAKMP